MAGKQFPVCARCTGVFLGQILGILLLLIGLLRADIYSILLYIACLFVILIDWYIQYKFGIESTNTRRFVTGVAGGYGMFGIYYLVFYFVYEHLKT